MGRAEAHHHGGADRRVTTRARTAGERRAVPCVRRLRVLRFDRDDRSHPTLAFSIERVFEESAAIRYRVCRMKTPLFALVGILGMVAVAAPASAQLAAPNALGVSIGHMHINATDVDAQAKFWTAAGGTLVQREKLTIVRFPGILVLLRKQDNSGGT